MSEYMKDLIFELWKNKWRYDWSLQLFTLKQLLWIKAWKINSVLSGIQILDLFDTSAVLYKLSY